MYKTAAEALALVNALRREVEGALENVEIVVCPPFTALYAVSTMLQDSDIKLGAQNVHWEKEGASMITLKPHELPRLSQQTN